MVDKVCAEQELAASHDWYKIETGMFDKWQCSKCKCVVASGCKPPAFLEVLTFSGDQVFMGNCAEVQVLRVMTA